MSVFVDTSALYALLDADDDQHHKAAACFRRLLESRTQLVTTSYVVVEATSIAHKRLGRTAARTLLQDVVPVLDVAFVDGALHEHSVARYLEKGRGDVSIVDCASFETMDELGVETALAFDRHFGRAGYKLVRAGR